MITINQVKSKRKQQISCKVLYINGLKLPVYKNFLNNMDLKYLEAIV